MSKNYPILNSYHRAKHAIAWVELFICQREPDEEQTSWDMLMSAYPPFTIQEVHDLLKKWLKEEVELHGNKHKADTALSELDTDHFWQYLKGKMGMM